MFRPFAAHSYAANMTTTAPSNSEGSHLPRRLPSPPQPVPGLTNGGEGWEDAVTRISSSPATSDAEQFLDCYSEVPSTASSFGDDSGLAVEELISRGLPRLGITDTLAASASAAASSSSSSLWQQQFQEERQQRLAVEATAAELRQQLDDISAVLFAFHISSSSNNNASSPSVAAVLQDLLQEAAEQAADQQQLVDSSASSASDAALVARLVAGICVRAALAADLEARWAAERALLERRLEQSARMGQAMLKHQKEHSTEPEPWCQQLLSTVFAVGCSILGGAAAVLLIRRTQGA